MKVRVRVSDVFDHSATVNVYDDVEAVFGNTIFFEDGEECTIDNQYVGLEIIEEVE